VSLIDVRVFISLEINKHPWRIRRSSNVGHIFPGKEVRLICWGKTVLFILDLLSDGTTNNHKASLTWWYFKNNLFSCWQISFSAFVSGNDDISLKMKPFFRIFSTLKATERQYTIRLDISVATLNCLSKSLCWVSCKKDWHLNVIWHYVNVNMVQEQWQSCLNMVPEYYITVLM
jgi:hypothetical protein